MTTRTIGRIGIGFVAWAAWVVGALAQGSPRPFAVGGGEGGVGEESGLTGWLMAEQSRLTHLIAAKVHALHGQPGAAWGLIGLGRACGVFHAAGPGHGKAVLASYMVANETSLKRGAVMALMAALLQAVVAIGLVGAAGFVFNATASQMNRAADWIVLASYCGVAVIGLWLVWRKGGALLRLSADIWTAARRSPPRRPMRAWPGGGPLSAFLRLPSTPPILTRPQPRPRGAAIAMLPTPLGSALGSPGARRPER